MTKFSLKEMPEIFVSETGISKAVSEAVARGKLRKLASRLYTKNLDEEPEKIVRRNWYYLITGYFPDALISDRTAIENEPAADGSIFLIAAKKRDVELPGLVFRPRKGPAALESDRPFIGRARLASTARAYLENMRPSRARSGKVARTLSRAEMEERLDAMIRRQGEYAVKMLRDEARRLAPVLELEKEGEALSELIGSLLGTSEGRARSALGKARLAGKPFALLGVNSDAGFVGSFVLNEYNFDILRPPTSFQDILDGRAFRGGAQRFRLEAVPGNIVSRY
ncbi:MAG: hypothetical protein IID55_04800, partial [Proteobacteria bacterium]|nr:hypothetical protein [Pseudomonadota bacterium]